jgi:hypothetical protein
MGFGYVLRKQNYSLVFVGYYCLRAMGGLLASLLRFDLDKSRYHLVVLKGRILGWLG